MADVLTNAASHLGEGGSHYKEVCGISGAWCAAFVSTILLESGEGAAIGNNKFTLVTDVRDYYAKRGQYFDLSKTKYTPQPGDIVIWRQKDGLWAGQEAHSTLSSHTGFVESVDLETGQMTVVDGNWGNKVSRHTLSISTATGFCQPHYQTPPVGGGNYTASVPVNGTAGGGTYLPGQPNGVGWYEQQGTHTFTDAASLLQYCQDHNISHESVLFYNGYDNIYDIPVGTELKIPVPEDEDYTPDVSHLGTNDVKKKHQRAFRLYHPIIKAEFFKEGSLHAMTATATSGMMNGSFRYGDYTMDYDIVSVTTQRSLSDDGPSAAITLTTRQDWFNNISPNDLVIIRMGRHPEESVVPVFIGVVNDIRKTMDFTSGQPQRAVQVMCSGMAKAYTRFNVGMIQNIAVSTDANSYIGDQLLLADMNSNGVVQYLFNKFTGKCVNYTFANGKSLRSYVSYHGEEPITKEFLHTPHTISSYNGSLWNLMKEMSNAPFNETYWDTEGEKAVLIHRPTPFNPEQWGQLKRNVITDEEIVTDATGRSDMETYTVFIVDQKYFADQAIPGNNPVWFPNLYTKYGISQLQVKTTYEVVGSGSDAMKANHKDYLRNISNWNCKNDVFQNGQLTVKGRANYHIGTTVVTEYNNMEYYVESVTHNFTVYGAWTTTLGLTRGIEPSARFTAPWNQAVEMTPQVMQAIINGASGTEASGLDNPGFLAQPWQEVQQINYTQATGTYGGGAAGGAGGGVGSYAPGSAGGVGTTAGNLGNGHWTGKQWVGTPPAIGNRIDIPSGLGNEYTYMAGQMITASGSPQKALRDAAGDYKYDPATGIATINGKYVIAVTPWLAAIGDYVTIALSNGQTLDCIVGEFKGVDANNMYGHNGGHCVVEFLVDKTKYGGGKSYTGTLTDVTKVLPAIKGASVTSVTPYGNFWGSKRKS